MVFAPGDTRQSVIVHVRDDTTPEGAETFYLQVYEIVGMYTLLSP